MTGHTDRLGPAIVQRMNGQSSPRKYSLRVEEVWKKVELCCFLFIIDGLLYNDKAGLIGIR
jgi:hypothetical protein